MMHHIGIAQLFEDGGWLEIDRCESVPTRTDVLFESFPDEELLCPIFFEARWWERMRTRINVGLRSNSEVSKEIVSVPGMHTFVVGSADFGSRWRYLFSPSVSRKSTMKQRLITKLFEKAAYVSRRRMAP